MTYEEVVQAVRNATKDIAISKTLEHIAYQFNIEGEAEGAFYLEISGGKINVEPYEYYDRDMIIGISAATLLELTEGKMQPLDAYTKELLRVYYGDEKILKLLPFGNKKSM